MKQVFYFHGGPGFNANPEMHLLTKPLTEAGFSPHFWHEPSSARPHLWPFTEENAFDNWLRSAEAFFLQHYTRSKAVLVTHSFGCRAAIYIALRHPDKVAAIIINAPSFCLDICDRNMFGFTISDFTEQQDERLEPLTDILSNYTGQFDDNTIAGIVMATQNANLFNYYWHNKAMMQTFLSHYVPPYAPDFTAYFAVRKTHYPLPAAEINVPAVIVFGKHDRLSDEEKEREYAKTFLPACKEVLFSESAHYPHVEEIDRFIDVLKALPL